jgi:hypothetical protein
MAIGIDGGIPVEIGTSASLSGATNGTSQMEITRYTCPGDCPVGLDIRWVGQASIIAARLTEGNVPRMEPADLARFLVQLEIDAGSPGVGEPVDVLRLLPSGPVWVQQKSGCPIVIQ